MEPRKKRKRILRPVVQKQEPEMWMIDPKSREELERMFYDDLLYGISGAHVTMEGITRLSLDEIMQRYEGLLTEEQKLKLKEYGKQKTIGGLQAGSSEEKK